MLNKFLLIGMFLISVVTYGQDTLVVRDLETWSSINLKYKINKKWSVALQGQLRLDTNSSEVNQYFGQFDVEYSFSKHFEVSGALRYIKKNDHTGKIQGYEDYLRYHIDGTYKHKLNNLDLKYRVRYQTRNELEVEDESKQTIRFKTEAVYNIKKWKFDPELSGELFRSAGANVNHQLESYRITFGTTFKVHKSAKMKLFYRYDQEVNTDYPLTTNIVGVKYTYSLK
ncbi:opacity protein-like surface antigen [Wenyingzhuangia aestuarii]|nr:opacity protein-like surface antigen [Wenyingzhuangia aestuarii]